MSGTSTPISSFIVVSSRPIPIPIYLTEYFSFQPSVLDVGLTTGDEARRQQGMGDFGTITSLPPQQALSSCVPSGPFHTVAPFNPSCLLHVASALLVCSDR
ncbi:hypothetical protein LshimejAT787_0207680 [Lyophyllum shimeji]|uniref:Uncharacterized protein n=1 Tax=Lyophyllum shimeji TaxID=47721 RepID=A0A9P3PFX5_LYOSH|nr:hypothetical protein LshimejAT787_0207680 [Lyophyllum shimeji]